MDTPKPKINSSNIYTKTLYRVRKAMFIKIGIICSVWLILFACSFAGVNLLAASPNTEAVATASVKSENVSLAYQVMINNLRSSHKLSALKVLPALEQSAKNKSVHMAVNHYWGHVDPSGVSYKDFIWNSLPQAKSIGENLAECFPNREAAFAALVKSPTHLAIMLNDFKYFGVGEAYDSRLGCTITAFHFANM